MRLRATATATAALLAAFALTGCGDDDKDRSHPPGSDCAATASMSQAEWLRRCAGGSGGTTTPPTRYTAPVGGQKVRMPNGIELSVTVEPIPLSAPGVTDPPSGTLDRRHAGAGETPVLVTLTITNATQAPYDVSGIFIRGVTGTVNGGDAQAYAYPGIDLHDAKGTIAPGRSTTATGAYALPDGLREGYKVSVSMATGFVESTPDGEFTGTLPSPAPTAT